MDIKRFFINADDIDNDFAYVRGDEFFHATKVLRQKLGYTVILSAGDGYDLYGVIDEISKDYVRVKITEKVVNDNETKRHFILLSSIVKESDFIIQKAVELGVTEFIPIITQYVNAKLDIDRARRIAAQAIKQCERGRLMIVKDVMTYAEALEYTKDCTKKILPYENATEGRIKDCVNSADDTIAILIGPEGGFSESEIDDAIQYGYKTVTLGKRILRAETATISALTLALDASDEL